MPIEKTTLAPDLEICRILNGMWQVAGGHGQIDTESAIEDMASLRIWHHITKRDLPLGIWQTFTVLQNL